MRVIVVDREDWEPLTIVEVPSFLKDRPYFTMMTERPFLLSELPPRAPSYEPLEDWTVDLQWVLLRGCGPSLHMAFPRDATKALLLRAAFLPGQRRHLHDHPQDAASMGGLRLVWR